MKIACSTCGTALTPGMTNCSGCGLPLVTRAVAIRAPLKQPLLSGLQWTLLLGGGFVIFLYAINQISAKQDSDARAQLISELHGGALSTPEGFQSHCGKPQGIVKSKNGDLLDYGNVMVSFTPSVNLRRQVNVSTLPEGMPADEKWALDHLNCKP